MNRYKLTEIMMDCLILCLTAGSLSTAFLSSIYIDAGFAQILMITAGLFVVLRLLLWNRQSAIISAVLAVVAVFVLLVTLKPDKLLDSVFEFLVWEFGYISGRALYNAEYAVPTIWLWTAAASIVYFILIVKLRQFILPFMLGSALLSALWFLGHTGILWYVWLFALGSILVWEGSYHKRLTKRYEVPGLGLWLACALPFAIIILITARLLIPSADSRDLRWDFLVEKVEDIQDAFNDRYGFSAPRQPFRLSETGFPSSSEQLGGPVVLSGDIVFKVSSSIPLYLRGSILNEYISTGWIDNIDDKRYRFSDSSLAQVKKSAYNFDEAVWHELDNDKLNELFPSVEAEITHTGINSSVIFNAQQPENIIPVKDSYTAYYNYKGESFTSRKIKPEEPYKITARVPNLLNLNLQDYLTYNSPQLDWKHPLAENLFPDPLYMQKVQAIQQNYMNIPDTVPQRVYGLVNEITAGKTSHYEKIIAIRNYLRDNYEYTLKPPFTPAERDFVDYFLFELKEGYCTYFATALAVMGRAAGVPTRYVEGFMMPREKNSDGIYEVRKSNGHAWVEVYFPKVGWLPFDATPYDAVTGSADAGNNGASAGTSQDLYWQLYWQQLMQQQQMNGGDYLPGGPDDKNQAGSYINLKDIGITALIVLGSLIIVLLAAMLAVYLGYWHRVQKQSCKYQHQAYYKEILWLLKLYGSPVNKGETPYEYAKRVDQWLVNKEASMMDIAEMLIASEFGNHKLTIEDIAVTKAFYKDMRSSIIKVIGWARFIYWSVRRMTGIIMEGRKTRGKTSTAAQS